MKNDVTVAKARNYYFHSANLKENIKIYWKIKIVKLCVYGFKLLTINKFIDAAFALFLMLFVPFFMLIKNEAPVQLVSIDLPGIASGLSTIKAYFFPFWFWYLTDRNEF